jgi:hypothetical protein
MSKENQTSVCVEVAGIKMHGISAGEERNGIFRDAVKIEESLENVKISCIKSATITMVGGKKINVVHADIKIYKNGRMIIRDYDDNTAAVFTISWNVGTGSINDVTTHGNVTISNNRAKVMFNSNIKFTSVEFPMKYLSIE